MPAFGLPGVAMRRNAARRTGLVAAAAATAGLVWWQSAPATPNPDVVSVTVLTQQVGSGVHAGTTVRYRGINIGSVAAIARDQTGGQRLELNLDRQTSAELTDALSMSYAAGNLFGISEVILTPGQGGTPLATARTLDLTGNNSGRAVDATMSTLLASIGQLTNDVLTPELTGVIRRIANDTSAYTPLIGTIVTLSRAVADTQRLPSPFLLEQYGRTLQGLPGTVRGVVEMLDGPFSNAYLAQPGKVEKFDANVGMVQNGLLPAAIAALDTGRTYYAGYVGMAPGLLGAIAGTVPRPARTSAELAELLRRLDAAFVDTPAGPVVQVSVALRGAPALAGPLSALASAATQTEKPR